MNTITTIVFIGIVSLITLEIGVGACLDVGVNGFIMRETSSFSYFSSSFFFYCCCRRCCCNCLCILTRSYHLESSFNVPYNSTVEKCLVGKMQAGIEPEHQNFAILLGLWVSPHISEQAAARQLAEDCKLWPRYVRD